MSGSLTTFACSAFFEFLDTVIGILSYINIALAIYCYSRKQIKLAIFEEEKARTLVQALKNLVQSEPQAYAGLIEGELSLSKGNTAEAIKFFQEAQTFVDTWFGHFALGRTYLKSEEYIEVHSEFELCLKRYGETTAIFLNDLPTFNYFPLRFSIPLAAHKKG